MFTVVQSHHILKDILSVESKSVKTHVSLDSNNFKQSNNKKIYWSTVPEKVYPITFLHLYSADFFLMTRESSLMFKPWDHVFENLVLSQSRLRIIWLTNEEKHFCGFFLSFDDSKLLCCFITAGKTIRVSGPMTEKSVSLKISLSLFFADSRSSGDRLQLLLHVQLQPRKPTVTELPPSLYV